MFVYNNACASFVWLFQLLHDLMIKRYYYTDTSYYKWRRDNFEPDSESVSNYVERVEVNEIAAAKQVSTFLTAIGKKTYGVLKDLVSPAKPKDHAVARGLSEGVEEPL